MNRLTPREYEVATLAAVGLKVKEIAYRLGIAHGTAKLHLHNIYAELGTSLAVLIQPLRHRFQLATNLVPGKKIEYAGLDGAFLTHCRLGR